MQHQISHCEQNLNVHVELFGGSKHCVKVIVIHDIVNHVIKITERYYQ